MPETTTAQTSAKPAVDIDPPACFYLGREYDLKTKEMGKPVMYDAHWLTTHGVVVGMTGSGKTGLCVSILEEAALDSIPSIIVDLKGDLTNLFLQFPDMKADDYKPWLDPEVAKRKKMTIDEMAEQTAATWKKGLADWYQQPERIQRLKDCADWRIYTPGSEVGRPVSILQSLSAPKGNLTREELNERVDSTTTALLGPDQHYRRSVAIEGTYPRCQPAAECLAQTAGHGSKQDHHPDSGSADQSHWCLRGGYLLPTRQSGSSWLSRSTTSWLRPALRRGSWAKGSTSTR